MSGIVEKNPEKCFEKTETFWQLFDKYRKNCREISQKSGQNSLEIWNHFVEIIGIFSHKIVRIFKKCWKSWKFWILNQKKIGDPPEPMKTHPPLIQWVLTSLLDL